MKTHQKVVEKTVPFVFAHNTRHLLAFIENLMREFDPTLQFAIQIDDYDNAVYLRVTKPEQNDDTDKS